MQFSQKTQNQQLDQSCSTVDDENRRNRQKHEQITGSHRAYTDQQPQITRSRVAHHDTARIGVMPKITCENASTYKRQQGPLGTRSIVRDVQIFRHHVVTNDGVQEDAHADKRHDRQRSRQSIDAVAAVDGVDADEQQKRRNRHIPPPIHVEFILHERHPNTHRLQFRKAHRRHDNDDDIQKALLRFTPRKLACIIKITCQHDRKQTSHDAQHT